MSPIDVRSVPSVGRWIGENKSYCRACPHAVYNSAVRS